MKNVEEGVLLQLVQPVRPGLVQHTGSLFTVQCQHWWFWQLGLIKYASQLKYTYEKIILLSFTQSQVLWNFLEHRFDFSASLTEIVL